MTGGPRKQLSGGQERGAEQEEDQNLNWEGRLHLDDMGARSESV
jgi:hypothetical protein